MITVYRIVDNSENGVSVVLADDIGTYEHAFQTLLFLRDRNPGCDIILEEYQKATVTGYGRDPDLH